MSRRLLCAGIIAVVAAGAQVVASTLPYLPGLVLPGGSIAVAGFFAATGFARRAGKARGRFRAGWAIAAAGACAMGIAYLLYCVSAVFGVAPADSPGEIFSVAAGVFAVGSVLALAPRLPNRSAWSTHVLDIGGAAAGYFAVTWRFVLAPEAGSISGAAQVTFVLTLLPEVASAGLALILISRTSAGRGGRALHLLAGSLALFALAAVITTRDFALGLPWHAGGAAAVTFAAAAMLVLASRSTLPPADESGWRSMGGFWAALPCVPIVSAISVAVSQYVTTGALQPIPMWTLTATAVFTTGRQLLSFMTVARLASAYDHLAHHDPLTGLANRAAFANRATRMLAHAEPGSQVALLVLDLDGFKPVNDTYGHAVGDRLLVTVAQRLAGASREQDVAARLGGDEFVLVVAGLNGRQQADELAARLIGEVAVPMTVGDLVIDVRTSVGIALAEAPENLDDLLKRADEGLYVAKAAGRCRAAYAHAAASEVD